MRVRQDGAWLTNFSINLVLSAALPEMMVGLERFPMHMGQGMPTRVLRRLPMCMPMRLPLYVPMCMPI